MRPTLLRVVALGLATAGLAVALASPAGADTIRIYAGSKMLRDAAGHRWFPAGRAMGGRRTRIHRPLDITSTPQLYDVQAFGLRTARLRTRRPGRYAVTLYLAEPQGRSTVRTFRVAAPGVSRLVDVPIGKALQRPLHTAFETIVRGRSLTLHFRGVNGHAAVAAIEAQRLGSTAKPPLSKIFHDDFDGPAGSAPDSRAWDIMTGFGWGPLQLQSYTNRPSNVALDGSGRLVLTARREPFVDGNGKQSSFTSGRIESHFPITLERVRVEARVKIPAGPGLWPVFWAKGVEPPAWPASGEVDIMEVSGGRSQLLYGFVHGPLPEKPATVYQNGAVKFGKTSFAAAVHTYAIRTEPDVVEFYIDGHRYGSVSRADIPHGSPWLLSRPYHLVFSLALGDFGGPVVPGTPLPAPMTVDHVSVWR